MTLNDPERRNSPYFAFERYEHRTHRTQHISPNSTALRHSG